MTVLTSRGARESSDHRTSDRNANNSAEQQMLLTGAVGAREAAGDRTAGTPAGVEQQVGRSGGRAGGGGSSRWRAAADRAHPTPSRVWGLAARRRPGTVGRHCSGPETKGEVVLTSEDNGSPLNGAAPSRPHRPEPAEDLGGRGGAREAGNARAGLLEARRRSTREAWPQGRCGPKARNPSSARSVPGRPAGYSSSGASATLRGGRRPGRAPEVEEAGLASRGMETLHKPCVSKEAEERGSRSEASFRRAAAAWRRSRT
ncbi:uncharacterized protein LOC109713229 [Ananas comosus]|uniref:Uncharacterized protein LOC109713229 n=1 Tax=Ananas comosus TaxID=4615 RepID=A0A6P5FHZ7_ANACO|nr:uncharacterized protein LOC109713229 [Ananas comosus]